MPARLYLRPSPDIYRFLDTKRENADEDRIPRRWSVRHHLRLAKRSDDMYLFSPYDVRGGSTCRSLTSRNYRSATKWSMTRIRKTKIKAREFFRRWPSCSSVRLPLCMFEDTVIAPKSN